MIVLGEFKLVEKSEKEKMKGGGIVKQYSFTFKDENENVLKVKGGRDDYLGYEILDPISKYQVQSKLQLTPHVLKPSSE